MEIRHLITFQAMGDVGSYTSAALKSGYTQSTITSHIQALELELGGPLLPYINREIQLAHVRRDLIRLADVVLGTHHHIQNMQKQNEVKGVLRVAAPESLTISRVGPIIREYSLKYPQVKLILSNGTCGQNQIDLMHGRVDIALMVYPKTDFEKCIHYNLVEEKIVLVGSNDGPSHFDEYKKIAPNISL